MSKTFILILGFILIVVAVILQVFNTRYSFDLGALSLPSNSSENNEPAFPLDDTEGTYTVIRISDDNYNLNYTNNKGITTSMYIDPNSPIKVDNFVGKRVVVTGRVRTIMEEVQCFAAPCEPIEKDFLVVTSINEKK